MLKIESSAIDDVLSDGPRSNITMGKFGSETEKADTAPESADTSMFLSPIAFSEEVNIEVDNNGDLGFDNEANTDGDCSIPNFTPTFSAEKNTNRLKTSQSALDLFTGFCTNASKSGNKNTTEEVSFLSEASTGSFAIRPRSATISCFPSSNIRSPVPTHLSNNLNPTPLNIDSTVFSSANKDGSSPSADGTSLSGLLKEVSPKSPLEGEEEDVAKLLADLSNHDLDLSSPRKATHTPVVNRSRRNSCSVLSPLSMSLGTIVQAAESLASNRTSDHPHTFPQLAPASGGELSHSGASGSIFGGSGGLRGNGSSHSLVSLSNLSTSSSGGKPAAPPRQQPTRARRHSLDWCDDFVYDAVGGSNTGSARKGSISELRRGSRSASMFSEVSMSGYLYPGYNGAFALGDDDDAISRSGTPSSFTSHVYRTEEDAHHTHECIGAADINHHHKRTYSQQLSNSNFMNCDRYDSDGCEESDYSVDQQVSIPSSSTLHKRYQFDKNARPVLTAGSTTLGPKAATNTGSINSTKPPSSDKANTGGTTSSSSSTNTNGLSDKRQQALNRKLFAEKQTFKTLMNHLPVLDKDQTGSGSIAIHPHSHLGTDNGASTSSPSQHIPKTPLYNHNIGIYTPLERLIRLSRFHAKRPYRVWTKKVKYDVRKNFADSRVRVKGRFIRKEVVAAAPEATDATEAGGGHDGEVDVNDMVIME